MPVSVNNHDKSIVMSLKWGRGAIYFIVWPCCVVFPFVHGAKNFRIFSGVYSLGIH